MGGFRFFLLKFVFAVGRFRAQLFLISCWKISRSSDDSFLHYLHRRARPLLLLNDKRRGRKAFAPTATSRALPFRTGSYPRVPRRTLMAGYIQQVVPLSTPISPKVVPTFGHKPSSLSATRLGSDRNLLYELTPADIVLSFGSLRFAYSPVVGMEPLIFLTN